MKMIAPVKLNLFLHIVGLRDDGYHFLDSLFVFASFGDEITISPATLLSLTIDGPFQSALSVESIEKNLVYRAALLLQKKYKVSIGAKIHLTKNIPIGAGLGGGSSDAAAILKGLNQLWNLNVDLKTLCDIGLSLGADIPACIIGKSAMVSGIGEIIKPIDLPFSIPVLLINPNVSLSTKAVFLQYKKNKTVFTVKTSDIVFKDKNTLLGFLLKNHNDLESTAIKCLPEIQSLLTTLKQQSGCELARMSGSGSTCFALFSDDASAQLAKQLLKETFPTYWVQLSKIQCFT